jgi:branched-chain amino acid transport system substrate-binding protein
MLVNSCTFLPAADEGSILIVAVIGPFSGDLRDLGLSMRNGIVLATEEQNEKGGLIGKQVQLKLFDSTCDYTTARDVTVQAIRDAGANFIIGAVCGEASEGVAQIASDEAVLMLNPASVNEGLTLDNQGEVRPFVYRIPFSDPDQGKAAAILALNKLNVQTASILVTESGAYESSLADAFSETFTEGGGEVLLRESYERNADSYYDVLDELRDENPDIIFAPGYFDVINRIVGQARAFGMNQVLVGSDGWDSPQLNKIFLDGCYFTTHFFIAEPRGAVNAWVQKYEDRFLVSPDTVATLSYDTANILFTAIEETGSVSSFELSASIQDLEFDTVTGPISFDQYHNPIKPVVILHIQNGRVVYDSRISISDIED